jgi:hypothetical protein
VRGAAASRSISRLSQAIGHPTSNSTIYNLLNRHGWRKPVRFIPNATSRLKTLLKKRFSQCCEESSAGCRQTWSARPGITAYLANDE